MTEHMTLKDIANQLMIVAQGNGTEWLRQERIFETYRFRKGYESGHLWGLANDSMKQGYHKFERERDYIWYRLPHIIEPRSFWVRNFTNWRQR